MKRKAAHLISDYTNSAVTTKMIVSRTNFMSEIAGTLVVHKDQTNQPVSETRDRYMESPLTILFFSVFTLIISFSTKTSIS